MDNIYWYLEYMKVFAAYAALLYIWPGIIFHKYLRGKGFEFRFLFCSVVQIVLVNLVVLGAGLFHILNVWVVRGFFYGPLIMSAGIFLFKRKKRGYPGIGLMAENLLLGKYGWKLFFARIWDTVCKKWKKFYGNYQDQMMQYFLLAAAVLFGMAYFSNGAFQFLSYGCSDQFTHHQWILGLQEGEIFSDGIYPEAMHCFIYSMNCLFGVRLYSCILFLAGIHSLTFLLAAYCLQKEVFQCRFTPLFVLAVWLLFDGMGEKALDSLSRMTWTLPQEFGLYLVFLCPLFLIRFLREERETGQWFQNENLLLLSFGVGATIAIHFYVTILAFFACLAAVLVYFWKMRPMKRIGFLSAAVLYGVEAGIVPMLAAYDMGMEPEGSLGWGVSTFQGISESTAYTPVEKGSEIVSPGRFLREFYRNGYVNLFGERGASVIVFVSLMIIAALCLYGFLLYYKRKREPERKSLFAKGMPGGYFFLIAVSVIFVFLYAAPSAGLPQFVAINRIAGLIQIWICSMLGVAVDFLLFLAGSGVSQSVMNAGALAGFCALYCLAFRTDFHEYPYWWIGRYQAEVLVTDKIMKTFPQYSYTIVSMNGGLYQLTEGGIHEEIFTFVQNIEEKEYVLPTEYIFLCVEKMPVVYSKYFYGGPSWLARKNENACRNFDVQGRPESSREAAQRSISYLEIPFDNYIDRDMRTVLNSKVYAWYQEFREIYPVETNIYYEDEEFICYMIHQNPNSQLGLTIQE